MFSVKKQLAIRIMLQGDFDYDALYEVLGNKEFFEHVSDMEPQRFSFHLRGVRDVFYQVYPTGKVRIDTDDYSDPYDLVRIIHEAAWLASGRNPRFKVLSCSFLPSTIERIGLRVIKMELTHENPQGLRKAQALARENIRKVIQVWEAVRKVQEEARRELQRPACMGLCSREVRADGSTNSEEMRTDEK